MRLNKINSFRNEALLFVLLFLFWNTQAQADFYFDETFFPVYVQKNTTLNDAGGSQTSPGVSTESGIGYDLRTTLGFALWNKMLVGFTYNYYKLGSSREAIANGSDGVENSDVKTEYGPSIGYLSTHWRFVFTYFLSAIRTVESKSKDTTGNTTSDLQLENTSGSGYQFAVGYYWSFGKYGFGPSIVYRNVTYPKQTRNNRMDPTDGYQDTTLYTAAIDTGLSPMFTFVLRF